MVRAPGLSEINLIKVVVVHTSESNNINVDSKLVSGKTLTDTEINTLQTSNLSPSPQASISKDLASVRRSTIEVDIRHLQTDLPDTVHGNLKVTPEAFNPKDEWADVLRAGLRKANLSGRVIEIGVGTGANIVAALAHHPAITAIWSSDYSASVAQLAAQNVMGIRGIDQSKFHPIVTQSDLLEGFRQYEGEDAPLDVIFACIPQVRLPENVDQPDQLAHYYSGDVPEGYEKFDQYDLTLNARLLMQAGKHLEPGEGRIILNLAGRVPMEVLKEMFAHTGFGDVKILHQAIIHQDASTRLHDFIKQEKSKGIEFEFFSTPDCSGDKITAEQAQALIDSGLPAFHKLYVIQGTYLGLQ